MYLYCIDQVLRSNLKMICKKKYQIHISQKYQYRIHISQKYQYRIHISQKYQYWILLESIFEYTDLDKQALFTQK